MFSGPKDEVFQGNFEFCEETAEELEARENKLKQAELISEAQVLISSWDTRKHLIKQGYEKYEEAYNIGATNSSGMVAWGKLLGYFLPLNIKEAKSLAEQGQGVS